MAKKRVVTTQVIDDADRSGFSGPDNWAGGPPVADDALAEASVQQIIDSVGAGDVLIKVSKLSRTGAEYCFSTEGEINEDFIQEQFGGGRYLCKIFVNGIYRKPFHLNIAERRKNPDAPHGGMADQTIQFLKEQIADLRSQLGNRNSTPVGELADAMLKLQQLSGGGAGANQSQMEWFMKGLEFARERTTEKGDDWTGIVREAIPVVTEMMKNTRGIKSDNPGGNPPAQPQRALKEPDTSDLIRDGIAYLKKQALRGIDPILMVDLAAVNADDPKFEPVLHFALSSDVSALAAYDPDVIRPPLSKWFEQFLDGLRQAFTPADNVGMDSSRESGNNSDTPQNGSIGKGGKSKQETSKTRQ